jgi:hypothetical protein
LKTARENRVGSFASNAVPPTEASQPPLATLGTSCVPTIRTQGNAEENIILENILKLKKKQSETQTKKHCGGI